MVSGVGQTDSWRTGLVDTAGFVTLALLLYHLTWQSTLHGTDWRWFVLLLEEPGAIHLQHPGYFVSAHGLWSALQPFGFDGQSALQTMSILGGALFVGGIHRLALAINGRRGFAACSALLGMVSPALWHHATVIELHAAFAGVMVWTLLAAVCWSQTGRMRNAVLTGALSGLATTMHGTGHLLLVLVVGAIVWQSHHRGIGRALRQSGAYVAAHMAVWGALFALIRATGNAPTASTNAVADNDTLGATDPFDYILRSLDSIDLTQQAWPTLLHEWVQPYAPFSFLLVGALFIGRTRIPALAIHLVVAAYLGITMTLVQAWTDERGAYLLPLLAPGILLALHMLRPFLWPLLLLLTMACGVLFRGEPERQAPDHDFGRAAAAMAEARPTVFFVADLPEMDGAFSANPRLDLLVARQAYDALLAAQGHDPDFEPSPDQIAAWLLLLTSGARDPHSSFVITDTAIEWLSVRVPGFDRGFARFAEGFPTQRLTGRHDIRGWQVSVPTLAAPTPR